MKRPKHLLALVTITSVAVLACATRQTTGPSGGADTSATGSQPTPPPQPFAFTIGDYYQSADGCQSRARHVDVDIPHAEMLDLGYAGVVGGIELREVTHVASAGYRNISFAGGRLSFDLYADGPGAMNRVPCPELSDPFKMCDRCVNGSGASIGYVIIAHYRSRPPGL